MKLEVYSEICRLSDILSVGSTLNRPPLVLEVTTLRTWGIHESQSGDFHSDDLIKNSTR